MFYDTALFPWLPNIEAHWRDIREEAMGLQNDAGFLPYVERYLYDNSWKVFGLYGLGVRFDRHCERAPKTTKLAETIPGMVTAGFSRLGPKTHIKPHYSAPPKGLLRLHVPVIVPEGCRLRVRDETRPWIEGQCFVFDDCREHEAWNDSDEFRTVLLVDFPAHDLCAQPIKRRRVQTFVNRMLGKQTDYNYLPRQ